MASPDRAPWPASARPTSPHWQRNAATSDAVPKPAPAPSPPPSAPRCDALPSPKAQCSNPAAVPPGPHAQPSSSVRQHTPQKRSVSLIPLPQSITASLLDGKLNNHLILD